MEGGFEAAQASRRNGAGKSGSCSRAKKLRKSGEPHLFPEPVCTIRCNRLLGDLVPLEAKIGDPVLLDKFAQPEPALKAAVTDVENFESALAGLGRIVRGSL